MGGWKLGDQRSVALLQDFGLVQNVIVPQCPIYRAWWRDCLSSLPCWNAGTLDCDGNFSKKHYLLLHGALVIVQDYKLPVPMVAFKCQFTRKKTHLLTIFQCVLGSLSNNSLYTFLQRFTEFISINSLTSRATDLTFQGNELFLRLWIVERTSSAWLQISMLSLVFTAWFNWIVMAVSVKLAQNLWVFQL